MDADLFHAVLARAVIEGPLHLRASGVLQYAGFLQLVLVVQQSVHELLHLQEFFAVSAGGAGIQHPAQDVALSPPVGHLYDPDFVVVIQYGLVEAFHHALKLVRVLVNTGRFRQVGQQRVLLLWKRILSFAHRLNAPVKVNSIFKLIFNLYFFVCVCFVINGFIHMDRYRLDQWFLTGGVSGLTLLALQRQHPYL